MALDVSSQLEAGYRDSCKKQEMPPNPSVLSSFLKMKQQQSRREAHILEIFVDCLIHSDFDAVNDALRASNLAGIDAIDICQRSLGIHLEGKHVLSLLQAADYKLRAVNFIDCSSWECILSEIFRRGLACQILNLKSSPIQKLHITGKFSQLRTLNLDFSSALTGLSVSCFSESTPKLMQLSLCGTRIDNLWLTTAALRKMPSLVELRFQNCLCCTDTRLCPSYNNGRAQGNPIRLPSLPSLMSVPVESYSPPMSVDRMSDKKEDFSTCSLTPRSNELAISNKSAAFDIDDDKGCFSNSVNSDMDCTRTKSSDFYPKTYNFHHPSPICFEKYYKEYMTASLPRLKVLDNVPIQNLERENAGAIFKEYYEYAPYGRQRTEGIVNILQNRETGCKLPMASSYSLSRSLCAAKLVSCPMPLVLPISDLYCQREGSVRFRPRQFEYHPTNPSLMLFGTLNGEIIVANHESRRLVGYVPSVGTLRSILGLCWLKKYPSKFIAGSDDGSLKIYDTCRMSSTVTEPYRCKDASVGSFSEFERLTSLSVNSTDECFLASGFSRHLALYDIGSGKYLQSLRDLHQEHINVVKFSNHSPSMFSTASFDRNIKLWDLRQGTSRPCYTALSSRGNVMVCFSPDDHYLLASAVDNEVKQLLAADGHLHMAFNIAPIGSVQNYTRSYYMNGRDYIVSGSCEESSVHICCARTGRRLRDVSLEGAETRKSMFVQSLRADPFKAFNLSVLAAYTGPHSKTEIIHVNLLSSSSYDNSQD